MTDSVCCLSTVPAVIVTRTPFLSHKASPRSILFAGQGLWTTGFCPELLGLSGLALKPWKHQPRALLSPLCVPAVLAGAAASVALTRPARPPATVAEVPRCSWACAAFAAAAAWVAASTYSGRQQPQVPVRHQD